MNLMKQESRWLSRGLNKRPIGAYARWEKEQFLSTFRDASVYKHPEAAGVGFLSGEVPDGSKIGVIDLDQVLREGNQAGYDFALDLVERADSYTEASQSGTGLHIIGYCDNDLDCTKHSDTKDYGCGVFTNQHFVVYTGKRIEWTPKSLRNINDLLVECLNWIEGTRPKRAPAPKARKPGIKIISRGEEFVSVDQVVDIREGYNLCPWCGIGAHEKTHNFVYDSRADRWHCFQNGDSGGGVQFAIAIEAGIISCKEAQPGALRGIKYIEMLEYAKKHGYIKEEVPRQGIKIINQSP